MEFESTVLNFVRTGSWRGSPDMNPVEVERGITYVRFTGMRIGNASDAAGGILLQFTYGGATVAWERLEGATVNTVRHLSTGRVAGRLRLTPEA